MLFLTSIIAKNTTLLFWYSLWSNIRKTQILLYISFAWNMAPALQPLAIGLCWRVGNEFTLFLSISLSFSFSLFFFSI